MPTMLESPPVSLEAAERAFKAADEERIETCAELVRLGKEKEKKIHEHSGRAPADDRHLHPPSQQDLRRVERELTNLRSQIEGAQDKARKAGERYLDATAALDAARKAARAEAPFANDARVGAAKDRLRELEASRREVSIDTARLRVEIVASEKQAEDLRVQAELNGEEPEGKALGIARTRADKARKELAETEARAAAVEKALAKQTKRLAEKKEECKTDIEKRLVGEHGEMVTRIVEEIEGLETMLRTERELARNAQKVIGPNRSKLLWPVPGIFVADARTGPRPLDQLAVESMKANLRALGHKL